MYTRDTTLTQQKNRRLKMTEKYIIRESTKDDCDQIMKMIRELAEYERLSDQVKLNAETLQRDCFGEEKFCHCLVAETISPGECGEEKLLVGYVLFYYIYSTFKGRACYIEDVYVTPAWRGKGIGRAMWTEVTKIAVAKDCVLLRWAVLDWNTSAIDVYKQWGGQNMSEKEGWLFFLMHKQSMVDYLAKYTSIK